MANQTATGGVGILTVLWVIFVVLKLVGVISWSWWLVLLPLYGPIILVLLFAVAFAFALTYRRWR